MRTPKEMALFACGAAAILASHNSYSKDEDFQRYGFVEGEVLSQDIAPELEAFGAGIKAGIQLSPSWATYLGYRKHSAVQQQGSPANGLVAGAQYNIAPSLFVFSEATKFSGYDASILGGAGLQYSFDDRWMVLGKIAIDSEYDSFFNLAVRYRFRPDTVRTYQRPRVAPPPKPVKEAVLKRFTLDVKFEHDSSVILPDFAPQTAKLARILQSNPDINVKIEGHTSLVGSVEYNQDLSLRRARAVKSLLVETYGISSARINAVGMGESSPIAKGETPEAQAQNRRVVAETRYKQRP
jgi:outer membrane protein OmpA-like peptidoglycan-associated protein